MRRPVDVPYTITTEFGEPSSYSLYGKHSGVDYAVPTGRAVYAPVAGKVVYARNHRVRGMQVVIFDGQYYHRLMHNSQFRVTEGQQVSEGQVVALSGSTGLSTGPHVHWDINTFGIDTTSWSQFVSPDSLLFAPQPTVYLPATTKTWAAYKLGSACRKGTADQVGTLLPSKFGGLTYKILGYENNGAAAVIQTEAFGRVKIWVRNTEAVIRG